MEAEDLTTTPTLTQEVQARGTAVERVQEGEAAALTQRLALVTTQGRTPAMVEPAVPHRTKVTRSRTTIKVPPDRTTVAPQIITKRLREEQVVTAGIQTTT